MYGLYVYVNKVCSYVDSITCLQVILSIWFAKCVFFASNVLMHNNIGCSYGSL